MKYKWQNNNIETTLNILSSMARDMLLLYESNVISQLQILKIPIRFKPQ